MIRNSKETMATLGELYKCLKEKRDQRHIDITEDLICIYKTARGTFDGKKTVNSRNEQD